MYCIILIHAERSVFDSINDKPSVFTCRACHGDPVNGVKALTFATMDAARAAARSYAADRHAHEYVPISPTLDIIEHARANEGTTFVQIDFNPALSQGETRISI